MSQPARPTRLKRNAVLLRAVPTRRSRRHRQDRAGAGADAVDRGDDRLRADAHRLDQVAGHAREHQQLGRLQPHQRADDLVHVAARAEVVAGAGEDDDLDVVGVAAARSNRSRSSAYESKVSGFLRSGRLSVIAGDAVVRRPGEVLRAVAGERLAVAGGERRVDAGMSSLMSACLGGVVRSCTRWTRSRPSCACSCCTAAASSPAKSSRIQPSCSRAIASKWRRPFGVRRTIQARRSPGLLSRDRRGRRARARR